MKRITEIDMVRGVTIILVVAAHTDIPTNLNNILSIFRMPLFFLVTGYLFSSSKYLFDLFALIKNRLVTLIVPYFSACMLSYIYWIITNQIGQYKESIIWHEPLIGFLNGNIGHLLINYPLWFLVCLFSSQILFCITQKILNRYNCNVYSQTSFYLILGFIGYFISSLVFLPWGIDIAFTAQLFLFIGYKLKVNNVMENMKPISINAMVVGFVFIIIAIINANQTISMGLRDYNNFLLFYVGGISGSILVLYFMKVVSKYQLIVNPLTYIGRKSLSILIFHVGFSFILLSYFDHFLLKTIELNWIFMTVGGVLISLTFGELLKKHPLLNLLFNGKKLNHKRPENKSVELRRHTI